MDMLDELVANLFAHGKSALSVEAEPDVGGPGQVALSSEDHYIYIAKLSGKPLFRRSLKCAAGEICFARASGGRSPAGLFVLTAVNPRAISCSIRGNRQVLARGVCTCLSAEILGGP